MSKRAQKLYLKDILDAITKIKNYTKDLSFEEFSKSNLVTDGVVRNFEIIGEASKNIPDKMKEKYPDVSWKEMAGMRDKVIHEYFGIDLEIIWKTVKIRLPQLKNLFSNMCDAD